MSFKMKKIGFNLKNPALFAMSDLPGKFNYLHFNHLWPLDREKVKNLLTSFKKTLLVENNSQAQLGQLLTLATGVEFPDKLLKYSGRPIYPEEIIDKMTEMS